MKSLKSRAISFCFMSLAWSTAAAESSFTPLGTGTGCIDGQSNPYGHSEALGVSADGSTVVGLSRGTVDGVPCQDRPMRWTVLGGFEVFDLRGKANAASADGAVTVGTHFIPNVTVGGYQGFEAFRWTQAGGFVGLGTIAGNLDSLAADVSADGAIVVGSSYRWAAPGVSGASIIWTAEDGLNFLPPLNNQFDVGGGVTAVSADGTTFGGYTSNAAAGQGYTWSSVDNVFYEFGALGGQSVNSYISGITADGSQVVGRAFSGGNLAIKAPRLGGYEVIGDLPGGHANATAIDISADGFVVVGRGTSASGQEAFIWDIDNGLRSLHDALSNEQGLAGDVAGWTLLTAEGISDDARVIVGTGINPFGEVEAFRVDMELPLCGFGNDVDDDGVCAFEDNCEFSSNADQGDADRDGIGDVCDANLEGAVVLAGDTNFLQALNQDNQGFWAPSEVEQLVLNVAQSATSAYIDERTDSNSSIVAARNDLFNFLEENGLTVSSGTDELTTATLQDVDVMFSLLKNPAYTEAEVTAMERYLARGGTIVFTGDNTHFGAVLDFTNDPLADLGSSLALTKTQNLTGETTDLESAHPLMSGVASLVFQTSDWITGGTTLARLSGQPVLGMEELDCVRVAGDHDGDDRSDVVFRHSATGANQLYVMNALAIAENVPLLSVSPDWEIVGRGDYNGDCQADILWRFTPTGAHWMFLMDGSSVLASLFVVTVSDEGWRVVSSGDHNGDGKSDILWHHQTMGTVWLYEMDSNVILTSTGIGKVPDTDWQIVGSGDYNDDGKADIFWRNGVTGNNWMYLMDGPSITTSEGVSATPDLDWEIVGDGDFDADGNSDVLWRNSSTGTNWIYFMDGTAIISSESVSVTPDPNWVIVGDGDYNKDGNADILWRNLATGSNWMFLLDGSTIIGTGPVSVVSDQNWQIVDTN